MMTATIISFTVAVITSQIPKESDPTQSVRCGSYCLTVALNALNAGTPSLDKIENVLGERGPKGYSLLQLEQAARSFGIKTALVETSIPQLLYRRNSIGEKFICLTLIDDEHFVLLYDFGDDLVRLCDPPKIIELDEQVFVRKWSGKSLLLSSSDILAEEEIVSRRKRRDFMRSLFGGSMIGLSILGLAASGYRSVFRRIRSSPSSLVMMAATCFAIFGCDGSIVNERNRNESNETTFGGVLKVEPERHRLGTIVGGLDKKMIVRTTLTNISGEPLKISDIVASCDCTRATLSKNVLNPGENATLETELKVGDSQEPRWSRIQLRSSSVERNTQDVSFEWTVDNPLSTSFASVRFPDLKPGVVHRSEIPIKLKHISVCKNCRIEVNNVSGLMKLKWVPESYDTIDQHVSETVSTSSLDIGKVEIDLIPQEDDMNFSQLIVVELKCMSEIRARLSLPMSWNYAKPVLVAPSRLFFGSINAGESSSKEILLRTSDQKKFRVVSVSCPNGSIEMDTQFPSESVSEVFMKIECKFNSKKGPWRDVILIETDIEAARIITVPVSALVE